jgi:hypothetical protein
LKLKPVGATRPRQKSDVAHGGNPAALYCFAYVATLTAYIAEASSLAHPMLHALGMHSHPAVLPTVFTTLLGSVVYAGELGRGCGRNCNKRDLG